MNTISPLAARPAADGYWTVRITTGDPAVADRHYVCRARDLRHAKALASRLAAADAVVWFDCVGLDDRLRRHIPMLRLGQSRRIDSADAWAALRGAAGTSLAGRSNRGAGVAR